MSNDGHSQIKCDSQNVEYEAAVSAPMDIARMEMLTVNLRFELELKLTPAISMTLAPDYLRSRVKILHHLRNRREYSPSNEDYETWLTASAMSKIGLRGIKPVEDAIVTSNLF